MRFCLEQSLLLLWDIEGVSNIEALLKKRKGKNLSFFCAIISFNFRALCVPTANSLIKIIQWAATLILKNLIRCVLPVWGRLMLIFAGKMGRLCMVKSAEDA